jgi:hypothetical protein
MGWVRCVCWEKLQCDFATRTYALIAPVQYVLHQVSCSYNMIPNVPKYYKTYWNITLGSNGVDRVRPLRKIQMWLRGTNFCINCTNSSRFAPSFMQLRPNCTQTLWNTPKTWVYGPMGRIRCVGCEKLQHDFVARTFALIGPVQYVLQQVSCSYGTIPNAPRYYKTDQNISLGSNGVDWVHSLRKISTWLCGTNFCMNCSSSPCFAPSFMQLRNNPKCTQILQNILKNYFRVHWGG